MTEQEVSTQRPRQNSVLQNMLGRSPPSGISNRAPALPQDFNTHRRRMSIGTTGMTGIGAAGPASPGAPPTNWARRASIAGSLSSEDSALEDCGDLSLPMMSQLSRRLSSGAHALRAARGNVPGSPTGNAEGFNFAENFRTRAERASMSASSGAARPNFGPFAAGHRRSVSGAVGSENVPPMAVQSQTRPKPVPAKPVGLTDPIQERILKGDFYMD